MSLGIGKNREINTRKKGTLIIHAHIALIIAEACQKYLQSFIATEILSQHFCQILQNISSQHYNFNFLKYF